MEALASDESASEEDVVDLQNNQANCLHCGEVHEGDEEEPDGDDDNDEEEEEEDVVEVDSVELQPPNPDAEPTTQSCDILDRNLYLNRIFVKKSFLEILFRVSLVDRESFHFYLHFHGESCVHIC